MEKVNITVRQVIATGELELFYTNHRVGGEYYWIEGYNCRDGHFEASKGYVYSKTKPVTQNAIDVQHFAKHWSQLGEGTEVKLVQQIRGPKGLHYGGD